MVNPRVVLNDENAGSVADKLHNPLEEQLTSALRVAADDVESQYHGEGVDEAAGELLEHAKDALHPDIAAGFHPDPSELRDLAKAIVTQKKP